MTITSVIQQIVQQVQFIGMLSKLNINWPTEWFNFTNVLNISSLDFQNLINDGRIPTITQRMVFIFVSICVPIAINLLLLIIFQPISVVLWYLTMCTGLVLLVAGLVAKFLPGSIGASGVDPLQFIIIGGALFGFAAIVAFSVFVHRKCTKQEGETQKTDYIEEQRYLKRFHRGRSLTHLCIFVVSIVIGLLCLSLAIVTAPGGKSSDFLSGPLFAIIGFVAMGIAGAALIYFLLNLCRPGRKCVLKVIKFAKSHLLLVMLTLISMSFIPTISYSVNMYLCHDYSCPVGSVFNPYAARPDASYDTSQSRYCDACKFPDATCGSNVSKSFTYCPGFSDNRWWKYPEISCSTESTYYFYIAAAIVLINYLLGIPLLWYNVITYLTNNIVGTARIGRIMADETEDEVWMRQMHAITPVAASMYDPYKFSRRYFALFNLTYRLIITFTLNIAAAYSEAAAAFVLVFHGMACAVLLFVRPYLSNVEQGLAVALAICNVLNGVYAVIVWQNSSVPSYTTWIFIVINGLIPAVAVLIVPIILRKQRAARQARADRRAALEQLHELEKMEKEEQAHLDKAHSNAYGASPDTSHDPTVLPPSSIAGAIDAQEAQAAGQPEEAQPGQPQAHHQPGSSSSDDEADATVNAQTEVNDEGEEVKVPELTPEQKARMKKIMKIRARANEMNATVLNTSSTTTMNKAFMFMGVWFLIALGIAFLGLLREPKQTYKIGGQYFYRGKDPMLAEYSSWVDFTSHCCCIEQQTPNPSYSRAERWICDNGNVLERGRVTGSDSGLFVRSMCSTTFRKGCTVSVDSVSGNVLLTCSDASSIVPQSVSQYAYDYLW